MRTKYVDTGNSLVFQGKDVTWEAESSLEASAPARGPGRANGAASRPQEGKAQIQVHLFQLALSPLLYPFKPKITAH